MVSAKLEYLAESEYILYSDNVGPKRTKFARVNNRYMLKGWRCCGTSKRLSFLSVMIL